METSDKAVGARSGPFSELELFRRSSPFQRGWQAGPWRLLDEFLGDAPRTRGFAPSVDVTESTDEYVVTAELPGAKPEDVTASGHGR